MRGIRQIKKPVNDVLFPFNVLFDKSVSSDRITVGSFFEHLLVFEYCFLQMELVGIDI